MIAASIPGGPGAEQAPQKLTVAPEGVNVLQPNQRPLPYQGDSKYGSLVNEYFGSNFYKPTNHMGMAMFEDPLFGNYSSQSGAGVYGSGFMDYLQNARQNMMSDLTNRRAKSPQEMERYNLIGEAYDKMFPGGNAFYEANQMQLPKPPGVSGGIESGILGMLPVGQPVDGTGFGPSIMDPGGSGTAEMQNVNPGGQAITNPSQVIGGGFDPSTVSATPGVNPIAPMPTMPTAPNMQPGHSHDDLLAGIGNLFQQYFPQQNTQQINQSAPQPSFDAFGNNTTQQPASNQVFGNMITPNFGGGY